MSANYSSSPVWLFSERRYIRREPGDALNTIYHAARSSVWATLMRNEITPPNRRVFELLEDDEMKKQYQEIVSFRNDPLPYPSIKENEVWEQGNNNAFTEYLAKSCSIIKKNYWQIFGKNFIDVFELLNLLKSKYDKPDFYSVMLSVNWKKMSPHYLVSLSHKDNSILLFIDAHNGEIKELKNNQRD